MLGQVAGVAEERRLAVRVMNVKWSRMVSRRSDGLSRVNVHEERLLHRRRLFLRLQLLSFLFQPVATVVVAVGKGNVGHYTAHIMYTLRRRNNGHINPRW